MKKVYVIVKKNKDWLVGVCDSEFETFKALKKVKRLKDVKSVVKCTPLKKHLNDEYIAEDIMDALGLNSFYIMDKPMYLTGEDVEEEWWSETNKKCKTCKKTCKQSSKVKVVKCND
jgi:hypothetical protein